MIGKKRKPYSPEEIIELIPKYFHHTRGEWAGLPFKLLGWQKHFIHQVFGNLDDDGFRIYRRVYIEIGKKNGKSEFGAVIALWLLLFDRENSAEVYSAAADREQAGIVYNIAIKMIELSPALDERCNIIRSRKTIISKKNGGIYRVLSSEAFSKSGYSIHGVIFDEFWTQPKRDLYDILSEGSGAARRQPLTVFLTTSGWDRESICYEIHKYAKAVLADPTKDPTFLPIIYTANEEDIESEKSWKMANPALGEIIRWEDFRNDYRRAMENPATENTFKRLRLNIWTDSQTRWLPTDIYLRAHGTTFDRSELKGRRCFGGLDLSSSLDLSAFSLCFIPVEEGEPYKFLHRFYIPKIGMAERIRREEGHYREWVREGWVAATSGDVIDYGVIENDILADSELYEIIKVGFDPFNSTQIIQRLGQAGMEMELFRQGYLSMSPASKLFDQRMRSKELDMGKNPVMRWMCSNVEIVSDPAANIKPVKSGKDSAARIDGVISSIMALSLAIGAEPEFKSVYEDHRLITI